MKAGAAAPVLLAQAYSDLLAAAPVLLAQAYSDLLAHAGDP
jgi:hypothetical protein